MAVSPQEARKFWQRHDGRCGWADALDEEDADNAREPESTGRPDNEVATLRAEVGELRARVQALEAAVQAATCAVQSSMALAPQEGCDVQDLSDANDEEKSDHGSARAAERPQRGADIKEQHEAEVHMHDQQMAASDDDPSKASSAEMASDDEDHDESPAVAEYDEIDSERGHNAVELPGSGQESNVAATNHSASGEDEDHSTALDVIIQYPFNVYVHGDTHQRQEAASTDQDEVTWQEAPRGGEATPAEEAHGTVNDTSAEEYSYTYSYSDDEMARSSTSSAAAPQQAFTEATASADRTALHEEAAAEFQTVGRGRRRNRAVHFNAEEFDLMWHNPITDAQIRGLRQFVDRQKATLRAYPHHESADYLRSSIAEWELRITLEHQCRRISQRTGQPRLPRARRGVQAP